MSTNVYEDIRNKLIEKGVPPEEIAFIHEANTELRKAELFGKVRSGQVRFLLGSTQKMGAGTNVQDRLIALHHLDVPWRPSDIEQQEGRILRKRAEEILDLVKKTEDEIHQLETRDGEIDGLLTREEVFTDVSRLMELNKEKEEIQTRLEELYEIWETLAE